MKLFFLVLLTVLILQCSTTKTSELYQTYSTENYLYWSENRKLTWNDFQGKPINSKNNTISEIRLFNPATIERANYFSTAELTSICVFDKKNSWADKKNTTETLLLYNQIMFNIYELYSRKLRKEFYNTDFSLDAYIPQFNKIKETIDLELKNRIDDFRKDADFGNNFAGIKLWEITINQELEELKAYKVEYK